VQADENLLELFARFQIDDRHRTFGGDVPLGIHANRSPRAARAGDIYCSGMATAQLLTYALPPTKPRRRERCRRNLSQDSSFRQVNLSQRVAEVEHGPQRLAVGVERQANGKGVFGIGSGGW
jgi:hypothetical protein